MYLDKYEEYLLIIEVEEVNNQRFCVKTSFVLISLPKNCLDFLFHLFKDWIEDESVLWRRKIFILDLRF